MLEYINRVLFLFGMLVFVFVFVFWFQFCFCFLLYCFSFVFQFLCYSVFRVYILYCFVLSSFLFCCCCCCYCCCCFFFGFGPIWLYRCRAKSATRLGSVWVCYNDNSELKDRTCELLGQALLIKRTLS